MKLKVLDALTAPGASVNEDRWGFNPDAVWIMDGATGVWPEQRLSEPSDAAWFVEQCDQILSDTYFGERFPAEILRDVVEEVGRRARRLREFEHLPPQELPSASFAAARATEGGLQLVNLGDCPTLWRSGPGPAKRFGDSGVAALDERLVQALKAERAQGKSFPEAKAAVRELMRRQRALMNTPEGYWILDLFGHGTPHAQVETIEAEPGALILLMTDGFFRLTDVYARHDADQLLNAAATGGLQALYAELREIEEADEECAAYTRFKPRDDATAVLLQVG